MSNLKPTTTYGALLGAVLTKLREEQDLTQNEVASELGIGGSTWSRIEQGESSLSTEQLKRIAVLFKKTSGQILDLADQAEQTAISSGISVEHISRQALEESSAASLKELINLQSTAAAAGTSIALSIALTRTLAFLPVFGGALGVIAAITLGASANYLSKVDKQDK